MKFLRDLHAVSEFFFYVFGFIFLFALLCWRNEFYPHIAEMTLRYGDLPFAFIALLFAGTSLRLSLTYENMKTKESEEDTENPIIDTGFLVVGTFLFLIVVFVDLVLPDVI